MKINGEMLTLAREYREVTQKELAEQIRVAQSSIAKIEGGITTDVSSDLIVKIASALRFPIEFFGQEEQLLSYGSSAYFYRKRATMLASERRRIHSLVNLHRIALRQYLKLIDVEPSRSLPQLEVEEYGSAAKLAKAVRVMWSLPDGPIRDLTALIESSGVVVIPCDFGTRLFDATSMRLADMSPMIFINSELPGDRWRYTLSHELAHLIMHRVPHDLMEAEADEFAAEFLTPAMEIKPQLMQVQSWRVRDLAQLKLYWRVSFHMLIMRAIRLNVLSKERGRKVFIEFAPERGRESVPIEREESKSFSRIISAVKDDLSFGAEGIQELLKWPEDLIAKFFAFSSAPVPKLRLVHS